MKTHLTSDWQLRRVYFNHDWLKNKYLPALEKCLNLLDARIEDPQFERTFVANLLPQWDRHYDEAVLLPKEFELSMSPRRLVNSMDFRSSGCDEKWLEDLMHRLWLARYPVKEWVHRASKQVQEANSAYQQLQEVLAECDDVQSAEALRPFRDEFAAFRNRCQELATAIEQFPSEIKVV